MVQIDHTPADVPDVLIVDRFTHRVIGRPWLSLAIDLATRTVPSLPHEPQKYAASPRSLPSAPLQHYILFAERQVVGP